MTAKIFLAHAKEDKDRVLQLHEELKNRNYLPWIDEKDLIAGSRWEDAIFAAIRGCDVFVACLSGHTTKEERYYQREFRMALMTYAVRTPDSGYLIPLKLDPCEIPDLKLDGLDLRLRDFQWLDYWRPDGLDRLVKAIDSAMQNRKSRIAEATDNEVREKLKLEIDHRVRLLPVLLTDMFTYTQLHTAKAAINGRIEYHPRVGKLGNFEALFPEFRRASLTSLLWELRQQTPVTDRETVSRQLASAQGLPQYFDKFVLLVPVGKEDSKWQVDRSHVSQLTSDLNVLLDVE